MSDVPKRQRITADEINCLIYAYLVDSGEWCHYIRDVGH